MSANCSAVIARMGACGAGRERSIGSDWRKPGGYESPWTRGSGAAESEEVVGAMLDDDDDEEARERRKWWTSLVGARLKVGFGRERGVISVGGNSFWARCGFLAFTHTSSLLISHDIHHSFIIHRSPAYFPRHQMHCTAFTTATDSGLERTRPTDIDTDTDTLDRTQSILPSRCIQRAEKGRSSCVSLLLRLALLL
jgi:hypothetical protein